MVSVTSHPENCIAAIKIIFLKNYWYLYFTKCSCLFYLIQASLKPQDIAKSRIKSFNLQRRELKLMDVKESAK
jgi:hypothetical protein